MRLYILFDRILPYSPCYYDHILSNEDHLKVVWRHDFEPNDPRHNDTKHKIIKRYHIVSRIRLSIAINPIMLCDIEICTMRPSFVMLNVTIQPIRLCVIKLSVIMLNVIVKCIDRASLRYVSLRQVSLF